MAESGETPQLRGEAPEDVEYCGGRSQIIACIGFANIEVASQRLVGLVADMASRAQRL
jgi:hypothetical protein